MYGSVGCSGICSLVQCARIMHNLGGTKWKSRPRRRDIDCHSFRRARELHAQECWYHALRLGARRSIRPESEQRLRRDAYQRIVRRGHRRWAGHRAHRAYTRPQLSALGAPEFRHAMLPRECTAYRVREPLRETSCLWCCRWRARLQNCVGSYAGRQEAEVARAEHTMHRSGRRRPVVRASARPARPVLAVTLSP
jgi:hypothetical protein